MGTQGLSFFVGITPRVCSLGLWQALCELGNSRAGFSECNAVKFSFWCLWEGGPEKGVTIRTLLSQRMLDVWGTVWAKGTAGERIVTSRGVQTTAELTVFPCPSPERAKLIMKRSKPRELTPRVIVLNAKLGGLSEEVASVP